MCKRTPTPYTTTADTSTILLLYQQQQVEYQHHTIPAGMMVPPAGTGTIPGIILVVLDYGGDAYIDYENELVYYLNIDVIQCFI